MKMSNPVSTLVLVGPTGVGKSLATQQLETLGFLGIDAIPPSMVLPTLEQVHPLYTQVVVVLAVRHSLEIDQALELLPDLQHRQIPVVYLDATPEVLVRRLSASRRRHPCLPDEGDILSALNQEQERLDPIRRQSSHCLNTSDLNAPQLLQQLEAIALGSSNPPLTVSLLSFGYKYGLPLDANLVFDVRFLPNPYFVPHLRPLTGQDRQLQSYLFEYPQTQSTYQRIREMVVAFLPSYQAERRSHLTIAIGCTGGQHRSVTLVERLAQDLSVSAEGSDPFSLTVIHRHLRRSQHEIAALTLPGTPMADPPVGEPQVRGVSTHG